MTLNEFEKQDDLPNNTPAVILPDYHHYVLLKENGNAVIETRYFKEEEGTGEFLYELKSPEGIHFWHYRNDMPGSRSFVLENAHPFIQIVFSIHNNSAYKAEHEESVFAAFQNYEYNMLYLPAQKWTINWPVHGKKELFALNLIPEIVGQYLYEHPFLDEVKKHEGKSAVKISEFNLPATPAIRTILYDILNCPLERNYKRLYLKAKVIELMAVLFSHHEQFDAAKNNTEFGLRKSDIQKMQRAREILHENIANPCSLIDLAHQVGTNENYLKKHFKQVFGNTVYGYIQELRMQQAKQLLANHEKSIQEVASLSGYKHAHHFIEAFKKYFGYAPIKLKILILFYSIDYDPAFLAFAA